MQKLHFSLTAIENVKIELFVNGQPVTPAENGFFGVLTPGARMVLTVTPTKDMAHSCYTLSKGMERIAKKAGPNGEYRKNLTVVTTETPSGLRHPNIPGWPDNMVAIETADKNYNIGIIHQNGRFFFVIVENNEEDEGEMEPGTVKWFNPLMGIGAVKVDNTIWDAKIHWTAIPIRKEGLRFLRQGEVLLYNQEDVLFGFGDKSTFVYEIKNAKIAGL